MSSCRILKSTVTQAGVNCVLGLATGYVGSAILSRAGYTEYSKLESTQCSGIGNVLVGAGVGLFKEVVMDKYPSLRESTKTVRVYLADMIFNTGLTPIGGLLGRAMLTTVVNMPVKKIAAALAVGAGVGIGAELTLGAIMSGCFYLCCSHVNLRTVAPMPAAAAAPVSITVRP